MSGNSRRRRRAAAKAVPAAKKVDCSPSGEVVDNPTPEQSGKVHYRRTDHTDEMGARIGFGYRREPWFETLARTTANGITRDELAALQFYRGAFDRCERSATRCALDVSGGRGVSGSVPSILNSTPAMVEARRKVRLCEEALGSWLGTLRAVALHDYNFSDIAIERFGGRDQDWIDVSDKEQPNKVRIVPRSGRHRDLIRKEFYAGLRLLTKRVRMLVSTPGIEEVWVQPGKATAVIYRGAAAPNGLYRLWGNSDRVDDLMSRLRDKYGDHLSFPTAQDARAALDEADGGSLLRLSDQELAR